MTQADQHLVSALGALQGSRGQLPTLSDSEWRDVAVRAVNQRVGPLLYSLHHGLPEEASAVLAARSLTSARRTLHQIAAARRFTLALAEHRIPVLALKGLHLALAVYPNANHREMNDIDLLVPTDAVSAANAVALSLGYHPLVEMRTAAALHVGHHLPRLVKHGVGIEIHWRLSPPDERPWIAPEHLWARAVPLPQLAPGALALSQEDALVHVCAHAGVHLFEQGLRPLLDVRTMLQAWSTTLDGARLVARAHEAGSAQTLALVLALVDTRLNYPVPVDITRRLQDTLPHPELVEACLVHMLTPVRELQAVSRNATDLLRQPSWRQKMAFLKDRVCLSDTEMAAGYPWFRQTPTGRWVGWIARGADLAWRYGRGLLRVARTDPPTAAALHRRYQLQDWLAQGDPAGLRRNHHP